jgi:hypothetical protein
MLTLLVWWELLTDVSNPFFIFFVNIQIRQGFLRGHHSLEQCHGAMSLRPPLGYKSNRTVSSAGGNNDLVES